MLNRVSRVLSFALLAVAAGVGSASACDRAVGLVQPQVFAFAPVQTAVPLTVAPLAVTPLAVTPFTIAPLHSPGFAPARAVRIAAVRPAIVRRGVARSVTRERTFIR